MKDWLASIGMEKYLELFEENEITLDYLPEITDQDLKDIGIKSLPHRKKILKAIECIGNAELDETGKNVIEKYPYLIAFPFREMMNQENPFLKIQLMKDVFLNILKYLGLITAEEYLRSDSQSRAINRLFREKLYQPQFGHWNHFIRETILFLEEENHTFSIPELPAAYREVELQKKPKRYKIEISFTDDLGDIQTVKQDVTAIEGLINFRNRYIGHSITLSEKRSNEIFETYYPLLKDLLAAIAFAADYPMMKFNKGKSWLLHGCEIKPTEKTIHPHNDSYSMWIQINGKQFPLVPFFILPGKYIAGIMDTVEVFIYEQYTGKRIVYFSPEKEKGETSGEVVRLLNDMLELKAREKPLSIEEVDEDYLLKRIAETSENAREELLREKKVMKGIYQPREENELSLRNFIKGKQPVYFLASEAGSGKTNLLNEMYRQFHADMGLPALLVRAVRMYKSDIEAELKHILNLKENENVASLAFLRRPSGSPFVILIDGMNEHQEPESLLRSVFDFTAKLGHAGTKLIISWRINSPDDFPVVDETVSPLLYDAAENTVSGGGRDNVLAGKAGLLLPLNRIELGKAWGYYYSHPSKQYRPGFTLEELEMRNREFARQLTNPLLLRLFMELYSGRPLPAKDRVLHIWNNWYAKLEKEIPGAGEILEELAGQMIKEKMTVLDLDSLYDHPFLGNYIRDLSIDNPYRQLIIKGILSQYFKDGYPVLSFTIEAAYHYVLSRMLVREVPDGKGEKLIEFLDKNKELNGVREAAVEYLIGEVSNKRVEILKQMVLASAGYKDINARPLALAFRIFPAEKLVAELMEGSPGSTYESIAQADFVLEKNLENETRFKVADAMITALRRSKPDNSLLSRALARYEDINYMLGYYGKSLELSFEILKLRETFLGPEDPLIAESLNKISISYRKLRKLEDSLEYGLKAMRLREKILPPDHMDLALSYDNMAKVNEKLGQYEKSYEIAKKLIAIYEKHLHPFHPLLSRVLNDTAITLRENGRKEESMALSRRAIEIAEKSLDPNHYQRAYCYWTLSETHYKFGEYQEALECMKLNISILQKCFPPDHPNNELALEILAKMEERVGNNE